LCEPILGETSANCPQDCKLNSEAGLSISFFVKQDSNAKQWEKTIQINSAGQAYFMIAVNNNSGAQIDNINISANIPSEISSLGNLQLDGVQVSGDIVSGVNIGSISQATTKTLTFEGKTQVIPALITKQAVATINLPGGSKESLQSDSVSISFNPVQAVAAAVSPVNATSGFWGFMKRWYLWILSALVLIFLFVAVFKRFSSEV